MFAGKIHGQGLKAGVFVEVHDLESVGRHVAAWDDLAARCLEPNPFVDPGFCLPAARHLVARGAVTFLLVWEPASGEGRRLIGLFPLVRPRLPGWPVAAVWFHDLSALGAPLLDKDCAETALSAFLKKVERLLPYCGVLMMTALDRHGPTAHVLDEVARHTGRRLAFVDDRERAVLRTDAAGAAAGLPALSSRRAKEIRRQHRRLSELGVPRYETAAEPETIGIALERFLDLEARGWKGKAGSALGIDEARAAFVREMVDRMAAAGRCRIHALTLGEAPVAMGLLLASRDRHYFWKTAFAEEHGALSPGVQFVLELTRYQKAETIPLTDSCAVPDHPMIDRLWPDRITITDGLLAIHPGRNLRFVLGAGMERARRRARSTIKTLYLRWRSR